jgi:serine/threonine-protein kinase mTOR
MKEDWNEWMRRCSVEMLKHTPNPVIMSCFSIAEVYSQIANELFNVAFASCWYILNDK